MDVTWHKGVYCGTWIGWKPGAGLSGSQDERAALPLLAAMGKAEKSVQMINQMNATEQNLRAILGSDSTI
jgi:hypothetical protein